MFYWKHVVNGWMSLIIQWISQTTKRGWELYKKCEQTLARDDWGLTTAPTSGHFHLSPNALTCQVIGFVLINEMCNDTTSLGFPKLIFVKSLYCEWRGALWGCSAKWWVFLQLQQGETIGKCEWVQTVCLLLDLISISTVCPIQFRVGVCKWGGGSLGIIMSPCFVHICWTFAKKVSPFLPNIFPFYCIFGNMSLICVLHIDEGFLWLSIVMILFIFFYFPF